MSTAGPSAAAPSLLEEGAGDTARTTGPGEVGR